MKTGRPRINEHEKKSSITGLRLNSEERKLLEKASSKSQKTLSEWMRSVLLETAMKQVKNNAVSPRIFDAHTDITTRNSAASAA